jgi:hypothetical protein
MLKKLSIALSVIAALGFAVASAPADAKPKNNNKSVHIQKNVHVKVKVRKNVVVVPVVRTKKVYVIGKRYNGRLWVGENRYFWRGAWYDYGVGRCWIRVNGVWFWNPVLCPI